MRHERRTMFAAAGMKLGLGGVSAEHVQSMAVRLGSPKFMLHDLRKMLATVGEKLGVGDAVLRRILNHSAPKTDVLHRHYVGLAVGDVAEALERIQEALVELTVE